MKTLKKRFKIWLATAAIAFLDWMIVKLGGKAPSEKEKALELEESLKKGLKAELLNSNPLAKLVDRLTKENDDEEEHILKMKNNLFDSMMSNNQPPVDIADSIQKAMRKTLEDPFDSKGWAKSKLLKKKPEPKPEATVFELYDPSDEELDTLRNKGEYGFH